ncbi:zinc finger, CCHC-type containing protein [Tanacetum coccineum]|uniref:Zinc finger, CCHC-type containing protein n=1 Tax=Tanacetum coccineum TaxID=301880 RepID=A0ABQ4XSL9_9ASTR
MELQVLADLPHGCKPLGCKWIFKRKLKVDGTIEKFNARLIIQGFKQKSGIDYFDTYAPVARISTIKLLIAMTYIHNLIIHQMDMKTAFLNGELEEEVFISQPQGFIMPGNKNNVCKLIKSLYGLKQEPKQWHQKFDEVVLSNGYLLNQADKCVYNKFDETGKGVIICLYVDDMLIFGTDQVQVDLTKEFLSSRFSMKDIGGGGGADVILGIRIKHESNEIAISQSHYIEKVLKKFNYFDCTPVSTPMDTCAKLMPNNGQAVSQLEYSRVIGCLIYDMTCTRPDIAFAVGTNIKEMDKIKAKTDKVRHEKERTPSWNRPTFYNDDDEYTILYRKHKEITPDLPIEEPDNSLSMGDEHLNTIPEMEKSSVENLVPIPSEFKGISEDICDVPSCDNDHFDAEFGLINSLLSRDSSITSPKIDFLPEEFSGELNFINPILSGIDEDDFDEDDCDEDDFDEEEGEIDIDIFQIEDEILCEKLLNVNLLVDKIKALKLTPSIPFVLEYPSSSLIAVVDSDFLIEEVDTFLVLEDSKPPSIESDLDSEEDIVFLDNLLNDVPIPEYERFTFDIEPDAPVINNFDELNEDECLTQGRFLLYFSPPGVKTPFFTLASPLRAGSISPGWNFHVRILKKWTKSKQKQTKPDTRKKEREKPRQKSVLQVCFSKFLKKREEGKSRSWIGPELVQETTDKVVLIKEKLKVVRDRQKSYADNRRNTLEFEVGDRVMLKVSPWKCVIRFGKKGKLAPRYVRPFEILERVGLVAYQLRLPEELSGIKVDKTLCFVEEPVQNSDREVKSLKCSRMVIVKCGVNLLLGTCLNCTYGDGKPVACCGCEGPLRGGFCSFCASKDGNSFDYNPNLNTFNESQNFSNYLPQPRKPKEITPELPIEEPDNSLSMGHEHLNTIPESEKTSVENLVPIPSEFKDSPAISPKIDFLPEEFVGELDFIDLILSGINEDDFDEEYFDEEEGEYDNDILQIEDEILREKLLNVNLLVDKIEALKLTLFIPFVLENPSSSPIPVVDSDNLVEEVDTFLVSMSVLPSTLSPIPVINNFDELNEDECFDPRGGEIDVSQNVKDDDSFTFFIRTFLSFLTYPADSPLLLSTWNEDTIFDPGIST